MRLIPRPCGDELTLSGTHKSGGWNCAAHYIRLVMSELVMKDLGMKDPVMKDPGFALFETAIGHCGIVWSERGVAGVQLPERNEDATRNRILRRFPGASEAVPSDGMQRAIDDIVALLSGEPRDLNHVAIDTDGVADFNRRVYAIARTIPPGATLSYGEIAELAAGGKVGGFSAPGGVVTKLRLLTIEGAQPNGPTLFDRLPLQAPRRRA
jgi:methylated-DNA-[protein]-cysteine S-methyltransferase